MTLPTPPLDLSDDHDPHGIAGTLHTPDPAAVAHLRALMAQQQPATRQVPAEPKRRQYSGDRIVAHLRKASELLYEQRRKTLTPAELAAAVARHDAGEGWAKIAKDYGMSHNTLMRRVEEARQAARRAAKEEKPQ